MYFHPPSWENIDPRCRGSESFLGMNVSGSSTAVVQNHWYWFLNYIQQHTTTGEFLQYRGMFGDTKFSDFGMNTSTTSLHALQGRIVMHIVCP